MNKKGFILSTYVYILLTFFLLILGTTLVVLNNTKTLAKKIKEESFDKSGIDSYFSLILQGDSDIIVNKGETFVDPGYIAQTTKGEPLEATVNSNVDTGNVGDYVIVYTATYNGETKSVTRKVKVEKYFFLKNFEYTGDVQEFTVPQTGTYQIELWGAQGGDGSSTYKGGLGGYTSGNILLNKNEKLNIYVGGKGITTTTYSNIGGYNGGGNCSTYSSNYSNGCGGGATDVRYGGNDLKGRIMVAGGGGGGQYRSDTSNYGGAGGGLVGGSAHDDTSGYSKSYSSGGTQVEGGTNGYVDASSRITTLSASGFGYGGGYNATTWSVNGGGGGYYGGGSGVFMSGGGGSSYISGYTGCVAVTSEGTAKTGCTNGTTDNSCSIHYSNKIFTDSTMIAGDASMPTHDGTSTMIGNEGNGYAKITYVGE